MSTSNFFWKRIFDNLFSAIGRPFSLHRKPEELLKRLLDLLMGLAASIVFFVPLLILALLVKLTSKGPALYWSNRVGRNNEIFPMPKLRTMRVGTMVVASHLLQNPDQCLTPIGAFLRKSSLDELPQLWCILRGNMSVVGPRPALFNQQDLIQLRTEMGVHVLRPGLTGWAQINGRDEIAIPEKVALDAEYLRRRGFWFDLTILLRTVLPVVTGRGVTR
jgi:O-antigen biosynthesis protein WbqP